MKSIAMCSAIALAALTPVSAFAQDTTESEASNWNGFYVGGTFGLNSRSNSNETVLFDTNRDGSFGDTVRNAGGVNVFTGTGGFCNGQALGNNLGAGCSSDKDDFDYSVRAGGDTELGGFVVGFYVDARKSDAVDYVTAFSTTPAAYTLVRKLDYSIGAKARIGYAAKGALFYALGGAEYGKIKNRFTTTNGLNSFANNGKTNSWGWSAGGGVEAKVAGPFTLGLEYQYTRFTDDDFRVNVGQGTAPGTNPFLLVSGGTDFARSDPRFDMHAIRITGALRF